MSHSRKTIRSAIATILRTTPTNWKSVAESRIESPRQIWPYLMVFAESETSDVAIVNNPSIYERTVNITVAAMLRLPGTGDTITIEDSMDTVAAEIETKLTQDTLRVSVATLKALTLIASSMAVVIEDDGLNHAELNMTWRVMYWTTEGLPETLI